MPAFQCEVEVVHGALSRVTKEATHSGRRESFVNVPGTWYQMIEDVGIMGVLYLGPFLPFPAQSLPTHNGVEIH
jgi:hypothetical protein